VNGENEEPRTDSLLRFENRSHGRVADGSASRGAEDAKRGCSFVVFGSRGGTGGGSARGTPPFGTLTDRGIVAARSNDAVSCGVGGGTFGGGSHDDSPVFRLQ
jgi:hypothetical protein